MTLGEYILELKRALEELERRHEALEARVAALERPKVKAVACA